VLTQPVQQLQRLYPDNTATQASTNLRKFRLAFNEAATEADIKLAWKVACWFEGEQLRTQIARKHSRQQADTGDEQLEAPTGISLLEQHQYCGLMNLYTHMG